MRPKIGEGGRIGHLVVDVDLVDHRLGEVGLALGYDEGADGLGARARPLDHHGDAGRLQPPPEDLGGEAGPLAQLAQGSSGSREGWGATAVRDGRSATSATRQSLHACEPATYSAPHDGHQTVALFATGSSLC